MNLICESHFYINHIILICFPKYKYPSCKTMGKKLQYANYIIYLGEAGFVHPAESLLLMLDIVLWII